MEALRVQREKKTKERERRRKTMQRAGRGRDGKRRLGRESGLLLERVRRVVGEGG